MRLESACVTLRSEDPDSLLAFYEDVLGMKRKFRHERFSEVEGPGRFRLSIERVSSPAEVGSTTLGFSVADLSAARRELERRGLLEREEADRTAGVRLLWFKDPEGRSLYLWELLGS